MIYCEPRSDTEILSDVENEREVVLLGCPVCANISLYFQKAPEDSPMLTLTPTGFRAVSMEKEVRRLVQVLNEKGLKVNSWVGKYPVVAMCVPDERNRKKIIEKCKDCDAVISFCCDAGKKSLENLLPEKKIIAGMNARGIMNASLKTKMVYANLSLDKKTVNITKFRISKADAAAE